MSNKTPHPADIARMISEKWKGGLIVSCQALPEEPLHSSYIMGKMAVAAREGGAVGIRANTKEDILEIRRNVDLPVIGIVKANYGGCEVYITPTMAEVDQLVEASAQVIAMDATGRPRPGGLTLDDFYHMVRGKHPGQLLMADCSTVEDAVHADQLGFDFIGTTLVGYTRQSSHLRIEAEDFRVMKDILAQVHHPVIAEGNINTPDKAKRVLELGAFCIVVGSAITRPQVITRTFVQAIRPLSGQSVQ